MPNIQNDIIMENAHIIFKNFSGRKSEYNREGDRNFNVIIPDEQYALRLQEDGWNVRVKPPRGEGDTPEYRLAVSVNFKSYRPPKIVLISHGRQQLLDEETVGILDQADISKIDLSIRPYNWEGNGRSGVKAYLKTMYATLEEDEFEAKYASEQYPSEPPFDI